jgi:hypothetical protein
MRQTRWPEVRKKRNRREPVLGQVLEVIHAHWETMRNR